MEHIITVSQLTRYIKQIFEAEELLFNISIVGEISNLKNVRGISYFDLKDEFSLISCVCFDETCLESSKNGDKVVVKGTPNFYVKGGRLNFNVNKVTPYGIGDLYKKFLEIKDKLEKEGLFKEEYKKAIPDSVKNIGVISSETGAVIQDIINVATRRNSAVNIILYPAKVQGEGSALTIMNGLDFFENYDVDVVIIARGGGSMEDLNEFNNESLARRIFDFNKPVISAVGHETDFTICDFVSDVRAPTPSAAAELAVKDIANNKSYYLKQLSSVNYFLTNYLEEYDLVLNDYMNSLMGIAQNYIQNKEYYLSLIQTKIEKYNPKIILNMGYARIEKNGDIVQSVKDVNSKDKIKIIFKDGNIEGEILWVKKKWILKKQARN